MSFPVIWLLPFFK
ncbi:hypothetical protein F383_23729 [Gossypium arboreum]|uniref:Uncharacterized protein n=1 Tax=Gossypium arboreum TaxID=29729 RepID=A0A0B0P0M3_GOSAR|nr:hypothetical protein F383_23729 [Gossypium arboreum]